MAGEPATVCFKVRWLLARRRTQGKPWSDSAYRAAVKLALEGVGGSVEHAGWNQAFDDTKAAWRAAYEREATRSCPIDRSLIDEHEGQGRVVLLA